MKISKNKKIFKAFFLCISLAALLVPICSAIPMPTGIAGTIMGPGAGGSFVTITAYETGTSRELARFETDAQGETGETTARYAGVLATDQSPNIDVFVAVYGNGADSEGENGVFEIAPGTEQIIDVVLVRKEAPGLPEEEIKPGGGGGPGGFAPYVPEYPQEPNLTGINMSGFEKAKNESNETFYGFLKNKTEETLEKEKEAEKPAIAKSNYLFIGLIVLAFVAVIIIAYLVVKKRKKEKLYEDQY